ncbi:MAG: hypothetical protein COB14_05850 [Alphaproteobacteria bacterium]|nr:MAG: hypothetical protein COB14_05850 [Alphaproteobacteria bacterium]
MNYNRQQPPAPEKPAQPQQIIQFRTLSKDTNTALREVASTINKMSKVFVEETDALNKTDRNAFIALQEQKLLTAQEYQSDMGQMIGRKNELTSADPAMKERLKKMQADFAEISSKNLEALSRMQRCTEKLGNTIRNAAIHAAQKQNGYSYGENGAISNAAKRKAISSGLSETV